MNANVLKIVLGAGFALTGIALLGASMKPSEAPKEVKPPKTQAKKTAKPAPKKEEPAKPAPKAEEVPPADAPKDEKDLDDKKTIDNN